MSRKTDGAVDACPGVWRMFEEAQRLKELHGEAAVFDFSVGNPNVEPPREFCTVVAELALIQAPGSHGYTSTAGYPAVRQSVAQSLRANRGARPAANVVMTCGAAGALNVIFRTILDPGDEVIVP